MAEAENYGSSFKWASWANMGHLKYIYLSNPESAVYDL